LNMNKLSILIILILITTNVLSQNTERCHTTFAVQKLIEQDPSQEALIHAAREQTDRILENKNATGGIYTVPVVFHVIYNTSEQNISETSIYSQLEILNEDYRKQNSDASNLPSYFSSVAADVQIEFCLAHVDPQGAWTDGVTRTQTNTAEWNGGSTMMMSASGGGHDPWPHSEYLNVWVVNMNPAYLGFAYPPGANPNGMVIGYKNFGRVGSYLTNPYNLGRTATHEIGHWLDLYHLWGPGADNQDCTGSDLVDDTPVQEEPNYNCPTGSQISCSNGPNGDMYMNFMDYVNDNCMVVFTEGQKARMRAALEGPRASILASQGCNLTSVYESDLSKKFSIYPNPTSSSITIDLAPGTVQKIDIRILDVTGKVILSQDQRSLSGRLVTVDISTLLPGIYFLEVLNGPEKATKRFSKI